MNKAMVMAAGLGMRMRPLTDQIPKPLVPVAGITLIDRTLDWLVTSGVQEAVVNSHYLADKLEAHLKARVAPKISISREEVRLETGGGIKKAMSLLGDDPFFVVNSDVICLDGKKPALHCLLDTWNDDIDALLLVHPVPRAVGYDGPGDFFVSDHGDIKRRGKETSAPFVFTGIQLLHPRLLADSPEGAFSLNMLYDRALQQKPQPRLRALIHDGDWLHVGDEAGLKQAEAFLANRSSS